jgi:hypothetical protein
MNWLSLRNNQFEGSEMTLNYRMIMERYPKPNGVVGSLISNGEIFFLLDHQFLFLFLQLKKWPCISCVMYIYIENQLEFTTLEKLPIISEKSIRYPSK